MLHILHLNRVFSRPVQRVLLLSLLVFSLTVAPRAAADWSDYDTQILDCRGRQGTVVRPDRAAEGAPWLFSAHALEPGALSRALLARGFHLAWLPVEDGCGADEAAAVWTGFYRQLVDEQGLAEGPALYAIGPDALMTLGWAADNTDKIACVYMENPWSHSNPGPDADLAAQENSPAAVRLGEAKIPVLLVLLGQDSSPAVKEQARLFYHDYRRAGQGMFHRVAEDRNSPVTAPGVEMHALYFILKHTGGLVAVGPAEPIPGMPEWQAADFVGGTHVYSMDDVLIIEEGREMTGVRWVGPLPDGEYEISLEAMRLDGGDFFCGLTAPWQDRVFSLIVGGWGGTCIGISSLDWLDAYHNETAQFRTLHSHHWYPVRLRVTRDRIQAWVNKEQLVNVEVGERDVDIRWEMAPTKPLGIATWRTTGAIRNFRITAL